MIKGVSAIITAKNTRKANGLMHSAGRGPSIGPRFNNRHGHPRPTFLEGGGKIVHAVVRNRRVNELQFPVHGILPVGHAIGLQGFVESALLALPRLQPYAPTNFLKQRKDLCGKVVKAHSQTLRGPEQLGGTGIRVPARWAQTTNVPQHHPISGPATKGFVHLVKPFKGLRASAHVAGPHVIGGTHKLRATQDIQSIDSVSI